MSIAIELPLDFKEDSYPEQADVISFAREGKYEELNVVVVSSNKNGQPAAIFGECEWDIRHYFNKTRVHKHIFHFSEFSNSLSLLIELKLIVYGWLFYKSSARPTPAKPSTLIARYEKLKCTYRYLLLNKFSSMTQLIDNPSEWTKFESYLIQQNYSQQTLHNIFNAINHVFSLQDWLLKDFTVKKIHPCLSGNRLSQFSSQQTLTIPERLADEIYGSAIAMVEEAYEYRKKIAGIENALQINHMKGKTVLDKKIKSGELKWLTDSDGMILNQHRYAQEILKATPRTQNDIVEQYLQGTKLNHRKKCVFFNQYYNLLLTACYICCAAFSGMRDSELSELTKDSYYIDNFDGKVFHMIQSRTFKLGEKKTTWVTAPVAGKAIQLASSLTEPWRNELNQTSEILVNTIWLSKSHRLNQPKFPSWYQRLKIFCKHFQVLINSEDYHECLSSNPNSILKIQKVIKPGQLWPLSSHQFRRSLAFYTIKHRLGTTIALKEQYKHLYLQMTEWYAEGGTMARINNLLIDNHLQELLDSTKLEDTTNKIFNFVHSKNKLSGSHGKAIVEMRNDIPYIYSSWDVIYEAVKSGLLTLHGTLHSYCKNGYNCDMDGVINPAFCVNCSSGSSIIDGENAKWWKMKHQTLTEYLSSTKTVSPSVYSHCILQIRAAESVMKDFDIEFCCYKHPVEIIEL